MFGLLSDIREFLALLFGLGNWLLFGAFLTALGGLLRPWAGLVACAAAGAGLMFLAVTGHWLDGDAGKVARLEAALKAKAAKLEEIEATNAQLQDFLAQGRVAAEHNAGVIERLRRKIAVQGDRPDCTIPGDFIDELQNLR